jgi:adenine-specific DNA-methyltransferase
MIRYMGTKRHMAAAVHDAIMGVAVEGPILDLFAGTGSVAETFIDERAVVVNDAAEFIGGLLRPRFTENLSSATPGEAAALSEEWDRARVAMGIEFAEQLEAETKAIASGQDGLQNYMARAQRHVISSSRRARARQASLMVGQEHYRLASLHFSAGYLSLQQAIDVDAARHAIEAVSHSELRNGLLASWILALSSVLNAPGHTAQFLKASSPAGYSRVLRAWGRDFRTAFGKAQTETAIPLGTQAWRSTNKVSTMDALAFLRSGSGAGLGAIYADPPYTRDQYGRFYHLYETLFKYDYPVMRGAGRVREDTFHTGFSTKTAVEWNLRELLRLASVAKTPVVVSYPSNGLLEQTGVTLAGIGSDYFSKIDTIVTSASHSTLGASSGTSVKSAVEQLIICTP